MKRMKKIAVLFFLLAILIMPHAAFGLESMDGWSVPSESFGLPDGTVSDVISTLINWLLALLGILGLGGFVVAGIMYILAAGEKEGLEKAKKIMYYSVIGVVVGILGLVAVNTIDYVLN